MSNSSWLMSVMFECQEADYRLKLCAGKKREIIPLCNEFFKMFFFFFFQSHYLVLGVIIGFSKKHWNLGAIRKYKENSKTLVPTSLSNSTLCKYVVKINLHAENGQTHLRRHMRCLFGLLCIIRYCVNIKVSSITFLSIIHIFVWSSSQQGH